MTTDPVRRELTSSQAIELLEEILGTDADPGYHQGAEFQVRSSDDTAVIALARNFRVVDDGVWLRPLTRIPTDAVPFFIEPGNEAMRLQADGLVQLFSQPPRIVMTEATEGHGEGPEIEIRPASGDRIGQVSSWDLFTLELDDESGMRIASCDHLGEAWPRNPFPNLGQRGKI